MSTAGGAAEAATGGTGDRLDVLEEDVEQLHQAVADLMSANGVLDRSVGRLLDVVEDGVGAPASAAGAATDTGGEDGGPGWWCDTATPADWSELAHWVDQLIEVILRGISPVLAPCWPAHPGAVEDLAGARAAWIRAVEADELSGWIDRVLVPLVERFSWWSVRYCKDGHQPEPAARPTDRTFLPGQD